MCIIRTPRAQPSWTRCRWWLLRWYTYVVMQATIRYTGACRKAPYHRCDFRDLFCLKSLLDSKIARNSLQEASFALTGLMFSENSREWLYLPGGPRLSWIDHFYTWFYNDSAGSWHSTLSPRLMLIIISPLNLSRRIHLSEWCDLIGHSSLVQFDPMSRVSFPEFGCEAYFQPILNSTSKRFDSSKN